MFNEALANEALRAKMRAQHRFGLDRLERVGGLQELHDLSAEIFLELDRQDHPMIVLMDDMDPAGGV